MRTINDYRLLVVLCLLLFPAGIFAQPATGSVQVREDNVRSSLLNVTRQYTVCPPCNAYITLVTPDCIKTTPKRTEPNQFNYETK
jgi:hypothetical protein